ncbi:MAG: hypothetical protein LDL06_05030 [Candidatus Nitrosotenuis sp.]|nr:hypothetical protein [Candidatus Nitrosotenuis sp.]
MKRQSQILGDIQTTIPVVAALALYFFVQPKIGPEIVIVFFVAWIAGYILDYTITAKNSHLLRFERNLVFAALYKRFGKMITLMIHFTIEALIVLMIPVLFTYDFGLAASSVVALVFGVSHILAYTSNCKFVKKYNASL